ncbi:MAG: enoyl-CoA hydratase/isomerase family protein [Burkholderiales bacterium]|nr:MAG: enoyl-CoA hydratase/isomerase family protein [Burkholderiales bacterium]
MQERAPGPPDPATQDGNSDLLVEVADRVLTITLNRPRARNALTFAMYRKLAEVIRSLDEHPQIRALIITGAGGKAFAAGTDISEFSAFDSPADAIAYEQSINRILELIERCPVPTIAAVAGACTGGGFGIAACCDLRIATADARFGLPIARTLGNCLSLSNHARFAGLIGVARLKDMVLTARLLDTDEMKAAGALTEIVQDPEALMPRAMALAQTIASHAPLTMRVTKESLNALQATIDPEQEQALFLKAYQSRDFAEGVDAFLNKRKPEWTGT